MRFRETESEHGGSGAHVAGNEGGAVSAVIGRGALVAVNAGNAGPSLAMLPNAVRSDQNRRRRVLTSGYAACILATSPQRKRGPQ